MLNVNFKKNRFSILVQYDLSDNYFPVHMNATVDLHIWEPFIGTEFSIRCVITSFDNDFFGETI